MWFGTCMSAIEQLSTILAISFPAPLFAFREITLVACWPFEAQHGGKGRLWFREAPPCKAGFPQYLRAVGILASGSNASLPFAQKAVSFGNKVMVERKAACAPSTPPRLPAGASWLPGEGQPSCFGTIDVHSICIRKVALETSSLVQRSQTARRFSSELAS